MPVSGVDESRGERARIGSVELSWVEFGGPASGDASETPLPLVLVHGFTGHHDDWIEVGPVLGTGRRTIAVGLRGHGDSESPADASAYSFEYLMKDLLGLLEHLGIERCDLLGHSFGGMLVLRFALAHPERIRSLILMNTAAEVPEALSRDAWEKATEIAAARGMPFLQELSEKVGKSSADPMIEKWGERYWTHQRRRMGTMTPVSYRGVGQTFFDSDSIVSRLAEIDLPTLILVGDSDHEFLPGADVLEANLPHAQRMTLPGSGHHPHQENMRAWISAIEAFLGRETDDNV